jgi:hypothetical protein
MHAELGLPRPDRDGRIPRPDCGIGRIPGARKRVPSPLLIEDLARVMHTLGDSPRADRDRLVLVLGIARAFARATSLHSASNTSRFIPSASPCI